MQPSYNNQPLRKLFAGLVEQAFFVEIGVCEPRLTEYLVDLLIDFVHSDKLYRIRDLQGRRVETVVGMLAAAERERQGGSEADPLGIYRHIGDFALFWTGVFPEGLRRRRGVNPDQLLSYVDQGKESYARASELTDEDSEPPRSLLRWLSRDFEVCAHGLGVVRRSWEDGKLAGFGGGDVIY